VQPVSACLIEIPLSPTVTPEVKSKKKRRFEASKDIKPCIIVAKNEIAAMLKPIVAVAGRR
jgi:hypothetical protein